MSEEVSKRRIYVTITILHSINDDDDDDADDDDMRNKLLSNNIRHPAR